ncbi:MAG: PAM68 family protein [Hormoscilla sp. GM102CHS1]|nr:PAM68 family protein [Hormoscilla sp. GM102CHS1]
MSTVPEKSEKERDGAQRHRLPFEPTSKRQKTRPAAGPAARSTVKKEPKKTPISKEDRAIPEAVSKRMVRRMALLCGIPTALGMLTFGVSYGIYVYTEFKLPNVAVLLTSIGCFGLGILGLSYGVLSASWEEKVPGSLLGWAEFTTNFSRMTAAWRSVKEKE